jgi:hypothetical protein
MRELFVSDLRGQRDASELGAQQAASGHSMQTSPDPPCRGEASPGDRARIRARGHSQGRGAAGHPCAARRITGYIWAVDAHGAWRRGYGDRRSPCAQPLTNVSIAVIPIAIQPPTRAAPLRVDSGAGTA